MCLTESFPQMEMNTSSVIWIYLFQFLNLNGLARAAGTCFEWWSTIRRFRLMEGWEWEDLDLSASGALYRFIPRWVLRYLTNLNLASTQVTDRHFLQMMQSSTTLEVLDISYCTGISQVAIFQARDNLDYVQHIDISGNTQLTILAVACLCCRPNIALFALTNVGKISLCIQPCKRCLLFFVSMDGPSVFWRQKQVCIWA